MNISVIGAGYVGLATAIGFAEVGNSVICVEKQADRLTTLAEGRSPIFEPGLQEILGDLIKRKLLRFTSDIDEAINASDVVFIAVGGGGGGCGACGVFCNLSSFCFLPGATKLRTSPKPATL